MIKKVLIADDTKNIRNLLTACLEHEGLTVINVENGEEALAAFSNDSFDLAFLDIKMPRLSGTEVLRQIRGEGIQTPVIIITAFATIKNAVECTQMGAVAYLQKPFTTKRVKQVLKEIIDIANTQDSIDHLLKISMEKLSHDDFECALTNLKKVLSLDPTNGHIYGLLAKTYELMGDDVEAKRFTEIYKLFNHHT